MLVQTILSQHESQPIPSRRIINFLQFFLNLSPGRFVYFTRMQKLPNNAKAVLGAVTLALLSFASAKAGVLGLQPQRPGNTSLRSSALHGHAALTRLPVTAFKAGLVKNRRPANNLVAYNAIAPFLPRLDFAGAASAAAPSVSRQSRRCSASPRAPPIS